jgi:glycosyltransferase involved in cell wall biosynthesis
MSRRIDQLLAGFADGDAISQEARILQLSLRSLGFESDIYAPVETTSPAIAHQARPVTEYLKTPRDTVIFHYSIASEASNCFMAGSNCRRIVRYHNITPDHFMHGFDDAVAQQLQASRKQLQEIASQGDDIWAVSEFNATELKNLGFSHVKAVPLFFNPTAMDIAPAPHTLNKLGNGLTNILFVGRMAPNKCVEELLLAFGWYHRTLNTQSRLVLVGSEWSCPRYFAMLRALANRLDLPNVSFEGFVSDAGLAACYKMASIFVCPSRHEGYCLPLVEAMCHNVPVVARNNGGMPEALGGTGILYESNDPRELAALMDHAIRDTNLREDILKAQALRLSTLRNRDIAAELREHLAIR